MIYKRNRIVYYFVRFFVNIMFTMPIWVAYYQGYLSAWQISLLVALQFGVQMILEIPSGAIADMLGRKGTISLGLFIGALGIGMIPFAREFWQFLILVSFTGIMDALVSGAEEALLYDSMKQDKVEDSFSRVFSKAYIILQIGLMIGAFLGGVIYTINPTLPFFIDGLTLLAAFIASRFYIEPKIDSEKFSWSSYKSQFKLGVNELFKNSKTREISVFFIIIGGVTWASQMYFNTAFLTTLVPEDATRGWVQGGIRLINVLLLQLLAVKTLFSKTEQKIIVLPALMLLGYLPGIFLSGYAGVPFIYLATLASTLRWIYMAEIMNPLLESKYRATAISAMSMFANILTVSLYLLSGLILPIGGMGLVYSLLGLVTIVFLTPLAISAYKSYQNRI